MGTLCFPLETIMRKHWLAFGSVVVLLGSGVLRSGVLQAGGDSAEIKTLLDQALKAAGGADKLAKLKNVTWKMKAAFTKGATVNLNMAASAQGWDRLRMKADVEINGMQKNMVMVMTDKNAWVNRDGETKEPPAKEIDPFRESYFALRATHMLATLKGKGYELSHLGEVNVKDQPAIGLRISRKDKPDVNLYFDKKTYLAVKTALRVPGPQGQDLEIELFFSEHKEFGDLKHFTKLMLKAGGQEIPMEITDIEPQEHLDATLFARP
jgi:hypothetical protein